MAQKPPMPMGTMVASAPPANMTCASPILMVRQASPRAWLEVAQAEQVAKLGPRSLWYIENRPEAMFEMSIGIMKGESRSGPRSSRTLHCSVTVCSPPMPEPMNTPISSRLTRSRSSPESRKACQAACTPNWEKRSVRRISLGDGKAGSGSKSFTSAAICAVELGRVEAGDPVDAALAGDQVGPEGIDLVAQGVTTPKPVMTTRRSVQLLAIKSNGAA